MPARRKVYRVFIADNGLYKEDLFSYNLLKFPELLGYKKDLENILEFLRMTVFNTDTNPDHLYYIVDSSKDEFEDKWKAFSDDIIKLSK